MTTTVLICEDDLYQLQQVDSIIRNYIIFHDEQFKLGIPTQNPFDILQYVNKFSINGGIYFLDIDLKSSINGIELAKKIKELDIDARFIFITTHDEMAISAMQLEIRAFDFILKDQKLDEFMDQIRNSLIKAQKDIEITKNNHKQLFSFSIGNTTNNINMDDVIYITTSDIPHQVDLYTIDSKFSFYSNLNDIGNKYSNLFRSKRSCLVNPINIRNINYSKHTLELINGVIIKFSLRKSKELRSIL